MTPVSFFIASTRRGMYSAVMKVGELHYQALNIEYGTEEEAAAALAYAIRWADANKWSIGASPKGFKVDEPV